MVQKLPDGTRASDPVVLWRRLVAPFGWRDIIEVLLVGVAFLLYFAVRSAVVGRSESAYFNALDIIDLQRRLGFFWEDNMNAWVSERLFWAQAANIVYFWLLFPLMIVFALWLYYFRRNKYTVMRDTFLASGAIGLIIFWAYPVAPPRELPVLAARFDPDAPAHVLGFVDTVRLHLRYAHDSQSTGALVNPYAAMPCLHVGWNLLLGIGIVWAFWRERWMWIAVPIGVALPVTQALSVVATANHFLLDIPAGVVVSLLGFPVAIGLQRWGYPALGRLLGRRPWPAFRRGALPSHRHEKGVEQP
jgi:hypothetical protein